AVAPCRRLLLRQKGDCQGQGPGHTEFFHVPLLTMRCLPGTSRRGDPSMPGRLSIAHNPPTGMEISSCCEKDSALGASSKERTNKPEEEPFFTKVAFLS